MGSGDRMVGFISKHGDLLSRNKAGKSVVGAKQNYFHRLRLRSELSRIAVAASTGHL